MVLLLARFQFVYADKLTLDLLFCLPKQQPKGILQNDRIGALASNVSGAERSHPEQCGFDTHWRLEFQ
jgi:hypothetical protein